MIFLWRGAHLLASHNLCTRFSQLSMGITALIYARHAPRFVSNFLTCGLSRASNKPKVASKRLTVSWDTKVASLEGGVQ